METFYVFFTLLWSGINWTSAILEENRDNILFFSLSCGLELTEHRLFLNKIMKIFCFSHSLVAWNQLNIGYSWTKSWKHSTFFSLSCGVELTEHGLFLNKIMETFYVFSLSCSLKLTGYRLFLNKIVKTFLCFSHSYGLELTEHRLFLNNIYVFLTHVCLGINWKSAILE